MGKTVENYLLGIEVGAAQSFGNMAVFPLLRPGNGGPDYITLKEAIERGAFAVTETSQGGSVPELMVENRGDVAVLLLDGEELAGAKQNRVLNTTILAGPKSSFKIPVSCTEHGRWSYVSARFAESGNMMERSLRGANMKAVHAGLALRSEFHGDQSQVWDRIARMSDEAEVRSRTGAMKDVYEAKQAELDGYLRNFAAIEGQKGMIVFLAGRAVGFDFVSRPAAFCLLFPKLVKSYAMEAMLAAERRTRRDKRDGPTPDAAPRTGREGETDKAATKGRKDAQDPRRREAGKSVQVPAPDDARAFLAAAAACDEHRQESVGLGWYYRCAGRGMVGSALAVEEKPVHLAFFAVDEADESGPMAGTRSRRGFRS